MEAGRNGKRKKYKKWAAVVSSMVLSRVSVVPSYAASEGIARADEEWIRATEVAVEAEEIDFSLREKTEFVSEREDVIEIDATAEMEIDTITLYVELDYTINVHTRVIYRWQEMSVGDKVYVSVRCSDADAVYRIGIRDESERMTYVEGSGNLSHEFTITRAGRYAVFVENMSNTTIEITGGAMYPYG